MAPSSICAIRALTILAQNRTTPPRLPARQELRRDVSRRRSVPAVPVKRRSRRDRTGEEGRISRLKRRCGLDRTRLKGAHRQQIWTE
jgi:hypothetical protein